MRNKAELRKSIRDKRRSLSPEQQLAAADGLLVQLQTVHQFLESGKIALYLGNDGEIDTAEVMDWCWRQGKRTFVPVIVQENCLDAGCRMAPEAKTKIKNTLLFAPVTVQTRYAENQYGIKEPVVESGDIIGAERLDLVLTPLVAFDEGGNRIGMGGGFYDRTFAFKRTRSEKKPHLIGIAHEIQKVDAIVAEHRDVPLTMVVTDKQIYRPGKRLYTSAAR